MVHYGCFQGPIRTENLTGVVGLVRAPAAGPVADWPGVAVVGERDNPWEAGVVGCWRPRCLHIRRQRSMKAVRQRSVHTALERCGDSVAQLDGVG